MAYSHNVLQPALSQQCEHSTVQPPLGAEQISQIRVGLTLCLTVVRRKKT